MVVYYVMAGMLHANTESVIKRDMVKLQLASRNYVKQFMLLQPPGERDLLLTQGSVITQELKQIHQANVALYDNTGRFLYEAIILPSVGLEATQTSEDLELALKNKASFRIVQNAGKSMVHFSYPLYLNDHFYGVLCFSNDYTDLYKDNRRVLQGFTLIIILLFIGVFFVSYLLSSRIIRPLFRLKRALDLVAEGRYEINVTANTGDEIEDLTNSFQHMKNEIKLHIQTIEKEKEKGLLLEAGRRSFFNNVTHELKTPLTTISGYAQIIGEEDFDDPIFRVSAARSIQAESERLRDLVVELIEISKRQNAAEKKEKQPLRLDTLLASVCEDMSIKSRKYGIRLDYSGEAAVVMGQPAELRQVLINGLDNAIKYGNSPTITIRLNVSPQQASLVVTNGSDPIDSMIAESVFEPFVRGASTRRKEKGSSGLGLYISHQIVTEHQGTLSFGYQDGIAKLSITLPAWQQNGNK